jgi:hypothetical protein
MVGFSSLSDLRQSVFIRGKVCFSNFGDFGNLPDPRLSALIRGKIFPRRLFQSVLSVSISGKGFPKI